MPGEEEIFTPGAEAAGGIKPGGAVGMAAAISLLDQLTKSFSQIIRNPLAATGTFYMIGSQIEQHINKHLKESNDLTLRQRDNFKKLALEARSISTIAGAFVSLNFKIAQSTVELQRASLEMQRFANVSQMPGGFQNPVQAAAYMKGQQAGKTFEYNAEFGNSYTETYKRMNLSLHGGLGYDEAQRKKYVDDLTQYAMAYKMDMSPFLLDLRSRQRELGLKPGDEKKILDQLVTGQAEGKFGQLGIDNVLSMYPRMLSQAVQGGMNPDLAKTQVMSFMETSQLRNSQGKFLNQFGAGDLEKAMEFVMKFQQAPQAAVFQGLTGQKIPTGKGAFEKTFQILQDYVKTNYKDEDAASSTALFQNALTRNEWAQRFKLGPEQFGLSQDMVSLLRSGNLITGETPTAESLGGLLNDSDIMAQTDATKEYVKKLSEINKKLTTLSDMIEAGKLTLDKTMGEIGNSTGIPGWAFETVGLVGAGLLGRKMIGAGMKAFIGGVARALTTGVVAAPIISSAGAATTLVDQYGKPLAPSGATTAPVSTSTSRWGAPLSRGMKIGAGIGGVLSAGTEIYRSLEAGEDTGTAIGRGAVSGGSVVGGTLLGAKLGAGFGPYGALIGGIGGGILAGLGGDALNNLIFGERGDDSPEAMNDQNAVVPKIRIIISDNSDRLLADKTVKTDGSEFVRVMTSGVLRN